MATNNLDLFNAIKAALEPYVEGKKGVLSLATDQFQVLELLGESPGRFRVIIWWGGEAIAEGSRFSSGIVAHTLHVIVSHNRGLALTRGLNLSVGRAGDEPLMQLSNEVRDTLRGMQLGEGTSNLLEYQGADAVTIENAPLDAYQQTYKVKAALPEPNYNAIK